MKKILMLMMSFILLFTISCDDDSTIVGGGIDIEPELVGCEGTSFYDWTDFEFETSLDAGATTWLGFEMDETTLFSINLNQPGFHCAIFQSCDGELGSPPPLYSFMSNGNGQEVGIERLRRKINGYVSFVKGENPLTFPFRVFPREFSSENTFEVVPPPRVQLNGKTIVQPLEHVNVFLTKNTGKLG